MSTVNNLVNPAVSTSGEVDSLLIEKYDGQVKLAYTEKVGMMSYFDLKEVQGTNSVSNKYMGDTEVQALGAGTDVKGSEVEFDKNQLVIDTVVISRNVVGQLADVQDDIQVKGKLAIKQVDALSYVEDRMLIQQVAFGAIMNTKAKRTKPRVKGHGFSIDARLKAATTAWPNAIMAGVEYVLEKQLEQNTPLEQFACMMPWKYFNSLRDAERIVNATYTTASGATITGFVLKSYNLPIVPTNQMPNKNRDHKTIDGVVSVNHLLSKASNNNRYNVIDTGDDTMADVVALLFGTESLMVGRSIALQGEIFRDPKNKSYYIDTFMSEGAIPDRWEHCGILRVVADAKAAEDNEIRIRANRKVVMVNNVAIPTT